MAALDASASAGGAGNFPTTKILVYLFKYHYGVY